MKIQVFKKLAIVHNCLDLFSLAVMFDNRNIVAMALKELNRQYASVSFVNVAVFKL